jgi:hypothetical protein
MQAQGMRGHVRHCLGTIEYVPRRQQLPLTSAPFDHETLIYFSLSRFILSKPSEKGGKY